MSKKRKLEASTAFVLPTETPVSQSVLLRALADLLEYVASQLRKLAG